MEIFDAQVHSFLSDRPSKPWDPRYREDYHDRINYLIHAGQAIGPERVLIEMAEAGVDGAILSPLGVYGSDNAFELEAVARFPHKFRVLGWVDYRASDLESRVANDAARGMVGVRIIEFRESERHDRGEFDRILALCEELELPVAISIEHPLHDGVLATFDRYSGINFVIDHLGVGFAPPLRGTLPPDPFSNVPAVTDLARYSNVSLKLTGAPSLSREPYPFRDIWPAIEELVGAFGVDRVMWGSDFTRTAALHSYRDATAYLREIPAFSEVELEALYGKTLRKIFRWSDNRATPLGAA